MASFGHEAWLGVHKVDLEEVIQKLIVDQDVDGSGQLSLEEYQSYLVSGPTPELIELLQQGPRRMRGNASQEHVDDQKSEERELELETQEPTHEAEGLEAAMAHGPAREEPEPGSSHALIQHGSSETQDLDDSATLDLARKKNKKQKKWAAKELSKLEKTHCKRFQKSHHQWGRARDWKPHHWDWKGWYWHIHCGGWDDLGPLGCYKRCIDQHGWDFRHGVGAFCYKGCPDGYLDGNLGWCAERCGGDRDLPFHPKDRPSPCSRSRSHP